MNHLAAQYDNIFAESDWYKGLAETAPADQDEPPPASSQPSAPAPAVPSAEEVSPVDFEAQKQLLLGSFLSELVASPVAAERPAQPPRGSEHTAAPPPAETQSARGKTSATAGGQSHACSGQGVAAHAAPASAPAAPPRPKRPPARRWRLHEMRPKHVAKCLRSLSLGQYVAAFERFSIDGRMCDLLDEDLLELQLGMREADHRHAFFRWVDGMQHAGMPGLAYWGDRTGLQRV